MKRRVPPAVPEGARVIVPESGIRPTTFRAFAGYRSASVVQLTPTIAVVVAACRSKDQGLENENPRDEFLKTPFYAVCESHGSLVGCPTLAMARQTMRVPQDFCEDCRAIVDDANPTHWCQRQGGAAKGNPEDCAYCQGKFGARP